MTAFKMQWKSVVPCTYLIINEGGRPGKFYRWIYGREHRIAYYNLLKQVTLESMTAMGITDRGLKNQCEYLRRLCAESYHQENGDPYRTAKRISIALKIPLEVCFVFKPVEKENL